MLQREQLSRLQRAWVAAALSCAAVLLARCGDEAGTLRSQLGSVPDTGADAVLEPINDAGARPTSVRTGERDAQPPRAATGEPSPTPKQTEGTAEKSANVAQDVDAGDAVGGGQECPAELQLSAAECAQLAKLLLPDALPAAAGNRYGDNLEAARLGFLVFFDPRFSTINEVRCASCHLPEKAFSDGRATAEVIRDQPLSRNSPTLLNAARSGPFYFWDGRADSLWSQPLFAFENAREMASSRLHLAHALYDTSTYRSRYEALFGPLPELSDVQRFPQHGKPGDAAFDSMNESDRAAINLVAANLGKALESYMRKLATGASALDRYLAGDRSALEANAIAGLRAFVKTGCIECHSGPALSDAKFHALGTGLAADRGRAEAIAALQANPFNSRGMFFDPGEGDAPDLPVTATASDEGAFRTPSLRNLANTAPYGHDGAYADLSAFLASGHAGKKLSAEHQAPMTAFLLSLQGRYPERPWSDWPAR